MQKLKQNNQTMRKKIKTSIKFFRPKTLKLEKNPKYLKKLDKSKNKKDHFRMIHHPLTTESALKKIQSGNTIVFIVDPRSNKNKIKNTLKKIYKIKIQKVNTLISTNGKKKVFVKLSSDFDALDVANKIGFI
jgi:large subunit ribosomal protein L23Ae